MVLITIVNGVYKPTYNWGAPSCTPCLPPMIKALGVLFGVEYDVSQAMCKAQARWDEIAVPLCPHELKVTDVVTDVVTLMLATCFRDRL